jgi:hypothetical protein
MDAILWQYVTTTRGVAENKASSAIPIQGQHSQPPTLAYSRGFFLLTFM